MNMGMNRILTASLGVFGLLAILALSNVASASWYDVSSYVGVAAQVKNMQWDVDRGGNLFQKNHLEGDLFVGLTLNECVGIEAGYESTLFNKNQVNLVSGQNIFGHSIPPDESPMAVSNKFLLTGWHISILGYVPINHEYCTQLFAGVGINQSRIYQASTITAAANGLVSPFSIFDPSIGPAKKEFVACKTLLRLSVGIQSMLSECWGFRVFFNWVNTSRFGTIAAKGDPNSSVRVKDSFSYGIGLIAKF